jgi:hypothetical protein
MGVQLLKGLLQVAPQRGERTFQGTCPTDDYEVMPGLGLFPNDLAGGIA